MSIIDQLEQTVTPAILGNHGSVSHANLLEQFYAILAARLALPSIYSQLMRDDHILKAEHVAEAPLFEQLWQTPSLRQLMIQELASTHHIDEFTTMQLLINATPLAYRELKLLADEQFLPAFLQGVQASLRPYLPIWSAPIIGAPQHADEQMSNKQSITTDSSVATPIAVSLNKDEVTDANGINQSANLLSQPASENFDDNLSTNAIHASPAAHHFAENGSVRREKIRTRNQRHDLLLWAFLLLAAITVIGLLWALLIRPNHVPPAEPIVTAPVVVPTTAEPPAQVLTPIELIVGVDNSGSLYTCSALVGDTTLQSALQQALNSGFGEQAGMCQLTVQEGVATNVANMPIEILPNILTLLRSTPFARLQLQNDLMTIEAPDTMQLQRLITDIRTLIPAMMIDSTAPQPLPNNPNDINNSVVEQEGMATNTFNNQFESAPANNSANNVEYQSSDDDTVDSVPPPTRNNDDFNNAPPRSNGPISLSEVDDMASREIVVEPPQVRR